MILSAIRPKADEYFGPPPVGQGVRITGVSAISGSIYSYLTWISSSGQVYLFQSSTTNGTPIYKYTLNGNIATRDTSFNTGNLQYGARYFTSVSEPLNIITVFGYNSSATTGTHHTIDLTTGQVIHTLSDVYYPCFWFESATRGVMIYKTSYTSPIYARIVTFNGQVPTYGNAVTIISSSASWSYYSAIRSGTKYFVTNSSGSRAMFDSADSSVVSKATPPTAMGCAFLMSPDVIRYYTYSPPIGYYDYTISTNTFSARQSTNIPSAYSAYQGHVEYNPIRKRYIMTCQHEDLVTASDLSFTTDLQTFVSDKTGEASPLAQDVRTCYDDNGQWYAGYWYSSVTIPEAGAFTTAPVVMKKGL